MGYLKDKWDNVWEEIKEVVSGVDDIIDSFQDDFLGAIKNAWTSLERGVATILVGIAWGLGAIAVGIGGTAALIIALTVSVLISLYAEWDEQERSLIVDVDLDLDGAEELEELLEGLGDAISQGVVDGISSMDLNVSQSVNIDTSLVASNILGMGAGVEDSVADVTESVDSLSWSLSTDLRNSVAAPLGNIQVGISDLDYAIAGANNSLADSLTGDLSSLSSIIGDRLAGDGTSLGERISDMAIRVSDSIDDALDPISAFADTWWSQVKVWMEEQTTSVLAGWFNVLRDFFFTPKV